MSKRRKSLSRFEVLDLLREEIEHEGSLRKYAKFIGTSAAYVSDVMRGRRDPGPKILEPLGLRRIPSPPVVLRYEVDA